MRIVLVLAVLYITGCAGMAMKNEFEKQRGYTPEHMAEIEKYRHEYSQILAKGRVHSNAFNATEKVNADNRIKAIFCKCQSKLGEKCRQKPDQLTGEDRILWAKSNGAEYALAGMMANDNPLDSTGFKIDPAECQ